ncbi:MAG: hypothetical protein ACE5IP_05005 [Terriglobia bacterium]
MTPTLSGLALAGLNLAFVSILIYTLMKLRLLTEPVLQLLALSGRFALGEKNPGGRLGCVSVSYVPKLFAL